MKLFKYNQFINEKPLNENLDKAKKFMKDRELLMTAARSLNLIKGELKAQLDNNEIKSVTMNDFTPEQQDEIRQKIRTIKLSDVEIKNIEKNKEFVKIRELLGQKYIGWTYPFTYFYFIEMVPIEELFTNQNSLFNRLIDLSGLLDKLPKKFDHNFIDTNVKNNYEIIIDGLDNLDNYRKVKRVYDQLTPILKKDYNESAEITKDKFTEIAIAFDGLGGGDEVKKENLWRSWFGDIKVIEQDEVIRGVKYKKGDKRYFGPLNRYKDIKEFIKASENFLKSSDNQNIMDFYNKINKCNDMYGTLGADIVFDENGILIIEVKSFQANQFLNGHTNHCIKDSQHQWNSYVSDHNNKQYYIYNLNIPNYENLGTIGVTIEPGQRVRAAHDKRDTNITSSIKSVLDKIASKYNISSDLFKELKPMTDEEIEKRKKAKLAEREIVKKGLTIEKLTEYVKEDGADINKDNARALINAVDEDDYEKAKLCLELGALPNLVRGSESAISKAKNLDMIKLLVSYGSDMTNEIFKNVVNDSEALEYCLRAGLNPNFGSSLPFRIIAKGDWESKENPGTSYLEAFKLLLKYGAKLDDEGKDVFLKWAAEYGRKEIFDLLEERGLDKELTKRKIMESINWTKHANRRTEKDKKIVLDYLQKKLEDAPE